MTKQFRGWNHWQLWVAVAAFWLVSAWFAVEVLRPSATTLTHGFGAYYSASRLLSNGELTADIYNPDYFRPIVRQDSNGQVDDIYNANPPTTTLLLWPLSYLPILQARLLWTFTNVILLFAGLALLVNAFGRSIRDRSHWPLYLIILTFVLLFQPVIENFKYGQAYIFTFLLLAATTAVFFKNKSASRNPAINPINELAGGIALSFSLLIKTAGWPLLILLFWLRKSRFLASFVGASVVIFLITLPVFSLDMWLAYVRLLAQIGRSPLICVPAYQTTRSWLCHLFAPGVVWQRANSTGTTIPPLVTIVYFILGIACLIVLLRLARKQPDIAFITFVCWSILFLPLGELHHHAVMLIPIVWAFINWSDQSRFGRTLIAAGAICYLIPFPVNAAQFQSGWLGLFAYPYVAGAWLIFLGILWDHKSKMIPGWVSQQ